MSTAEILEELPKLSAVERRQILERICVLEDADLSTEEKAFIDQRLEECHRNPTAWSGWEEARERILSRLPGP